MKEILVKGHFGLLKTKQNNNTKKTLNTIKLNWKGKKSQQFKNTLRLHLQMSSFSSFRE